jgi:predicted metallo-beta-lactamase superfamily hydrolase
MTEKHATFLHTMSHLKQLLHVASRQQVTELTVQYITHIHTQHWKPWWNKVHQTEFKQESFEWFLFDIVCFLELLWS